MNTIATTCNIKQHDVCIGHLGQVKGCVSNLLLPLHEFRVPDDHCNTSSRVKWRSNCISEIAEPFGHDTAAWAALARNEKESLKFVWTWLENLFHVIWHLINENKSAIKFLFYFYHQLPILLLNLVLDRPNSEIFSLKPIKVHGWTFWKLL